MVSQVLAEYYQTTPELKAGEIQRIVDTYKPAISLETAGFIVIYIVSDELCNFYRVCIGNHILRSCHVNIMNK